MEKQNDMLLQVKDLRVHYTAGGEVIRAVNGVSLEVRKGQTLGLVGETGAGKTTIAKAILRILPDPPAKIDGGEIYLEGKELLSLPEKKMQDIRGKMISMIFQDPMTSLNPVMTVGAQLSEVIRIHEKLSRADAAIRAGEMLELVGIPSERMDEYPHQFSGGMKQRVVIAMALACNPLMIIADEPTTALDVTIQAQVLDLMRSLREKFGTATLMITHDLGVVAEICDRVAIIYAGQIVEQGTLEEIYENTKHPYTKGLFASLPDMSSKAHRLHPIKGLMPDPANLPSGCPFHPRCDHARPECARRTPVRTEVTPGHFVNCLLYE